MNDHTVNRTIYRLPKQGKIAGVCAGLAEAFGWETWILRLSLVIAAFLTGFGPVVIAYIIAIFILDPKPENKKSLKENSDECLFAGKSNSSSAAKEKNKAENRSDELGLIVQNLNRIKKRTEVIEAFVTSGRYNLEREFQKMDTK